ncbi:MAG: hypothetical protein Q9195_004448 [Heterodermia aff. obscurata]
MARCISCSGLGRTTQALASTTRQKPAPIHQRRHSSSKPSDTSKNEPQAPSEAPTEAKVPSPDPPKRSSTRLRRKARDSVQAPLIKGSDETRYNLPSVPSTQHLHPLGTYQLAPLTAVPTNCLAEIHVASFFSIHRPISVTTSVPPPTSETSFSTLFAPRERPKYSTADVIYTLSSAVDGMENTNSRNQRQSKMGTDLHTVVTQASASNADIGTIRHLDGHQSHDVHINLQELAKNFRPFVAPPAPVPMGSSRESTTKIQRALPKRRRTTQKSYSTTLTILESTHPNGRKTYQAQTSPIREEPMEENVPAIDMPPASRQPFLNRMRERQRRLEEWRDNGPAKGLWRAISVKRQRKLKMKKHKYKKLMRRTRNLRRKLDKN